MSAAVILRRAHRDARRHAVIEIALLAVPWIAAACALAWRFDADGWAWLLPLTLLGGCATLAWRRARAMDQRWLARTLDARRPDMEDSASLLLAAQPPQTALANLQRARLQPRIERGARPDLRTPWRTGLLAATGLAGLLALGAIMLWPHAADDAIAARSAAAPAGAGRRPPRLVSQQLEIRPPAYTGLPTRRIDTLSAKVPVGSELRWSLRYEPAPAQAVLLFLDGTRLALQPDGAGSRTARKRFDRAALYRLEPAQTRPGGEARLHRIDVIPDQPPRVRVLQPARTLSTVVPGQRRWAVEFEASDDYSLAATARLRIIRTEGSGENISAREQEITLPGSGSATRRHYAHGFDLGALGLVPGDDLIVQLVVSDRRTPDAQQVRSPSVILRWPPEVGEQASGLDGMLRRIMPAYFRSQRQIIIDAEALLKERPALAADTFLERSDGIGVDQRLLRLRYGQFLGEESEGGRALPTNDVAADPRQSLPTNDALDDADNQAGVAGEPGRTEVRAEGDETHTPDDGHDHGTEQPAQRAPVFGEETQVLERFGHTHDIPEAATLLDPKTRTLLRSALDEMWQSEVNLRQGHPELALPFANRALAFIKRVQQSERIYLAKLGSELPPIDESRRLGGKRDGLGDRGDPMRAAPAADATIARAWDALSPVATGAPDLDALSRWLATHDTRAGDPLALAAAIDTLRRRPACAACRQTLRDLLFPLIAPPPGAPAPRTPSSRTGDAYLDALRREQTR